MLRPRPRSRLASPALAAALVATLSPCMARAQDTRSQAARSFQAGSEAYRRKDFRGAGRAFDDAYRIAPRGAAAYNAGLAWEGAGERTHAADDYKRALEASDLGTAERADATGRLRALERTLGVLTLTTPAGARLLLDDVALPGTPSSLHVEPGMHTLRVDYADGRGEVRTLTVPAGGEQALKLGQPPEGDVPAEGPVATPPLVAGRSHDEAPAPPQHDRTASAPPADRTAAWIAFGGAAVAAGVAFVVFEEGLTARNELEKGGDVDRSLYERATTLRTATWVAWSASGALAVTGVVLYLTASPSAPAASVALHGNELTLRVRF